MMIEKVKSWLKKDRSVLRKIFLLMAAVAVFDLLYLLSFSWEIVGLKSGPTPESNVIQIYKEKNPDVRVRWQPVQHSIPRSIARVFIVAEDSRFYSHFGIDLIAIKDAFVYNWNAGRFAVGASTITQQTTKNLFLSHDRSLLRKWHEAILSLSVDAYLSKTQILRHYLNIAELGRGVFGVEAASQGYFGKSFSQINVEEAIELAASLPSPVKHNPSTRTGSFSKRKQRIKNRMKIIAPQLFEMEQKEEEEEEENLVSKESFESDNLESDLETDLPDEDLADQGETIEQETGELDDTYEQAPPSAYQEGIIGEPIGINPDARLPENARLPDESNSDASEASGVEAESGESETEEEESPSSEIDEVY